MENLTFKELEALRFIRNNIMHCGKFPGVRELMRGMEYKSSRSAAVILDQLERKGVIMKKDEGGFKLIENATVNEERIQTVDVPLVGSVACGLPLLAEQNIEAMIPVSIKLAKPLQKYFLLRANGNSMNKKGINNGDLVLIKQQSSAESGNIVVALIDNEATIKELKINSENAILIPHSTEPEHQPILLNRDFLIQGVVVTSIQLTN